MIVVSRALSSLIAAKPIRLGQGSDLETGTELGERSVVVLVGVIRAELMAKFVQDEAIYVLGHAVLKPLLAENANVVVERRTPEKVAGTVARSPGAAFATWPMDEANDERLADQSLRHSLRVIEDCTHSF